MEVVVEDNDPYKGAAYRVLWEKYLPFNIVTREEQESLRAEFRKVSAWAVKQDIQTQMGYEWAMQQILTMVDRRFDQQSLGDAVNALHMTIAKPGDL